MNSKATVQRIYGGVSGDERRAERRERLIEAGITCFGRDGYAATTTRSIAAEAGLTQRYFYESFDGVDHFFAQVVRKLGERMQGDIEAAVRSAPPAFEARLRAGVTAYLKNVRRNRYVGRILLIEAFTAGPTGDQVRTFLANVAELIRRIMVEELPKRTPVDLELLATGFVGAIHHIALRWVTGGFKEPVERIVDTMVQLIAGAVSALPEQGRSAAA